MQAKTQMFLRRNGRISVALCVILFMGCTVQGGPVQKGRYMRVRCRPDARTANCIEEQGPQFVIPEGGANQILPPKADPTLLKKIQDNLENVALSGDEYGSGNEIEPESGSGNEYDVDDFSISDFAVQQSDQDQKLKFTNEGLIQQKERL